MPITIPYLQFNGNAKEALDFYGDAFGATPTMVQTYNEMGDSREDEALGNRIVHARLEKDGVEILYFSDSYVDESLVPGNMLSIAFMFADEASLKSTYDILKDGGQVGIELQEMPWGGVYAKVTDKLGIEWQLNWQKA
ncbi:glyoxalase/bleomycin resistance/extradiol dioxygenase family protein [Listeria grandensis]|uniref:Glyoxalase/bleomycin resistance/extradiol dioxygenase family protein n=1 Tax=Listeria grandensis TaxID=1494963 RepID=A0A7X1CNN3_9LIST|nr:glyoxalase/bleomycin resistance/extradiol dioxygenase family protein [Listeria grandensis]MBC1935096.1 glyoxalase/bleomycin resistance/extradiol dioxygenase family protein [Listeria grandensis]